MKGEPYIALPLIFPQLNADAGNFIILQQDNASALTQ